MSSSGCPKGSRPQKEVWASRQQLRTLGILRAGTEKHPSVYSDISVQLFATPWTVACARLLHPWDFLGKSTGMGCHFLLQGIFLTQGSNPGLLHCRQTLYCLSHQGSPIRTYYRPNHWRDWEQLSEAGRFVKKNSLSRYNRRKLGHQYYQCSSNYF